MKIYDKMMNEMTPERLAEVNVKLVTVNNRNLFYMTSTGQLFVMEQYEDAVEYEYNWLMREVKTDNKKSGSVEEVVG